MQYLTTFTIWLFIINLGVAFGAGLYETRIVVPHWLTIDDAANYIWNAEAARRDDVGLKFWIYATTIPLTLLTISSLICAWQTTEPGRVWWLAAAFVALAERVMTFSYFVPTMIKLMNDNDLSPAQSASTALQWVNFGYVRHALVLAALLAALKALSAFGKTSS